MATSQQLQKQLTKAEYQRFQLFRKTPSKKDLKELPNSRIASAIKAATEKKAEYRQKVKDIKAKGTKTTTQKDRLADYQNRSKVFNEILQNAKQAKKEQKELNQAPAKKAKSSAKASTPSKKQTSPKKQASPKKTEAKNSVQSLNFMKGVDHPEIPRHSTPPIPEDKKEVFAPNAKVDSRKTRRKATSEQSEGARQELHFASVGKKRVAGFQGTRNRKDQGRIDAH